MTQIPPGLARYSDIVDDWEAFTQAVARPLRATVRVNSQRLDREALRRLFRDEGIEAEQVDWNDHALTLPHGYSAGLHWGLPCGLFHCQEEVAMLPVQLLNPQPGERVLDMCAAPGNKTAQLSLAMGGTGTVVANEIKRGRLSALRSIIKRLGLTNVSLTRRPAQEYPLRGGPFDRILVDAPCSGEGTIRKHSQGMAGSDEEARAHLASQQLRMLERAARLVRPGGRIAYATCTFAPEENECVVDAALRRADGGLRLVDVAVAGFRADRGLTQWQGRALDASLTRCLRIWPHRNDTGGFFVAVLERVGGEVSPLEPSALERLDSDVMDDLTAYFQLPAGWRDGLEVIRWGGRYQHLVSVDHDPGPVPPPELVGLPGAGVQVSPPKLTTAAAMRFGDRAARQVVDLEPGQAQAFIRRETSTLGAGQCAQLESPGYAIVRLRGFAIGLGAVKRADGGFRLASLYPKAWVGNAEVPDAR